MPLVAYTYDAFGNIATVVTRSDASTTRTTTYTYDKLNRVTKIEYPGEIVGDEEFGYDDAGNLWWKKDGNGDVRLYRYDDYNRLWKVYYNYTGSLPPTSYPTYEQVAYGYEGNSRLRASMNEYDSGGTLLRTSSYTYDFMGRLDHYTPPVGLASGYYVDYDYNNLGQKTHIKIRDDNTPTPNVTYDAEYEYYANGWLKSASSGTTSIADYSYDVVGNRTRVDLGNGAYTTYTYDSDPRYRLTGITHKNSSDATLAEITYDTRDKVGNPLEMEDWTGSWAYNYDDMNRLTGATAPAPIPNQPAGGSGALGYEYDWVGNRIHPPSGANPMVYNKADQLTSWPRMRQYTYYPDGSLEHVLNAGGTSTPLDRVRFGIAPEREPDGRGHVKKGDASLSRCGN